MDHHHYQEFMRVLNTCYNVSYNIIHTHNVNSSWLIKSLVPTIVLAEHTKWVNRSNIVCLLDDKLNVLFYSS